MKRFIEIGQAKDLDSLQRQLIAFAHDLDFGLVNASMVQEHPGSRTADFVTIGNTPEAFLAESLDVADSKRDPVNRQFKQLSVPFVYDQSLYVRENAGDLWERQAAFGYRSGVCVSLHLTGGRHFLVGMDRDRPLPEDGSLVRLMADLQLVAVYAQSAASVLMTPLKIHEIKPLSPREREVLQWSSQGKTVEEISAICGLSAATVQFHTKNAFAKLNVTKIQQAIAVAIRYGLI